MRAISWGAIGLGIAAGGLLASIAIGSGPAEVRLGFTPEAFQRQLEAEAGFAAGISRSYISETHYAMTRRPHPSGSEGAWEVADYLRSEMERAGLDVEVAEYQAYLSAPVDVTVELLSPVRETFSLMEPADPRDPDTSHPELGPAYIAYSASGEVTAPVVYVNYGLPPDYEQLDEVGIDVEGKIVLARYGRSHRAVKVHTAQERGAVGVIFYSDPADDGFARGEVWPDGMWRSEHLIQRGNAKFSWYWHGDPLTPGTAATREAPALDPTEAPTLPRIPVAAMSWGEAQTILRHLRGSTVVPQGFQGGLPFTYHTGPGEVTVRLSVQMDDGFEPIYNVVGRIEGTTDPDRWVLIGTHHDAWTFGAIDPFSAAAVILEVARGLSDLKSQGWEPARSILFAFWDAEEFGLVGSTEYAEDREAELQEKAVVYLNSDMYTPGRFVAGGSPSLRDFIIELAKDLSHGSGSLYEDWVETEWERASAATRLQGREEFEVELNALGSGADFVAFQDYVGLPTLSLEFLFEGGWGFGTYHSNYDTRFYVEEVSDPDFEWGVMHARLLGTTVMRLASAPMLPYRYSHYAHHIRTFLEEAEAWAIDDEGRRRVEVDTGELRAVVDRLEERTLRLEAAIDGELRAGRVPERSREINDLLMRLDQALLDRSEPADVRWYRHLIYGWNIYALYSGQPLPHLFEAIRVEDPARVADEKDRIHQALERMLEGVEAALEAAEAGSLKDEVDKDQVRARDLGVLLDGTPGPYNAITDVAGVEVGHATVISGEGPRLDGPGPARTGVTAIFPRGKANLDPVFGGMFTLNGTGEVTGSFTIEERGFVQGPVLITNTWSVGTVRDAALRWQFENAPGYHLGLPVVGETADYSLNDRAAFHVREEHVFSALDGARGGPVAEGNVGGGTGMICHGFKAGIGTASRTLTAEEGGYTVGVLVQCNYGVRRLLQVAGVPVGRELTDLMPCIESSDPAIQPNRPRCPDPEGEAGDLDEEGSIIAIVATDAPLLPHQLTRVAKRVSLGVGKMGGLGGDSSGDIFLAFSTANPGLWNADDVAPADLLPNQRINPIFEATVQATEEAILNSMIAAETMVGLDYLRVEAIPHDRLVQILSRHDRLADPGGEADR